VTPAPPMPGSASWTAARAAAPPPLRGLLLASLAVTTRWRRSKQQTPAAFLCAWFGVCASKDCCSDEMMMMWFGARTYMYTTHMTSTVVSFRVLMMHDCVVDESFS
jgi:hypothetical protein